MPSKIRVRRGPALRNDLYTFVMDIKKLLESGDEPESISKRLDLLENTFCNLIERHVEGPKT